MTEIMPLLFVAIVSSVVGFWTENIWNTVTHGFIDNRGMMFPALFGYGLAMIALYMIIGTPAHPRFFRKDLKFKNKLRAQMYYLFMSAMMVSIGEVVLGNLVEDTCGIIWWNYTEIPLHIGRYTSLPTSIGFGTAITIFMDHIFPNLYNWAYAIQTPRMNKAIIAVMVLLTLDMMHSGFYMLEHHAIYMEKRIALTNSGPLSDLISFFR